LRAIAGLEQPCGGSIAIDGGTVYSASARRNLATEKRGVSMVFQSYAIWPHMNVFENVAYGLRVRRLPRAEINRQVERALALVQMTDYAGRSASRLSGGQQQRVAVARAIAFSPNVVLFDEPLSNLDAKLRAEMRVELRELQHRLSFTSVYVTHDQEEALAISDRVIVMNGGRIEQIGTPTDIYDRPRNRFVADFVGSANLIAGRVRPGSAANGTAIFETAEVSPCGSAPTAPCAATRTRRLCAPPISMSASPTRRRRTRRAAASSAGSSTAISSSTW
jgi:iron(III) transport system ATP-binding protein